MRASLSLLVLMMELRPVCSFVSKGSHYTTICQFSFRSFESSAFAESISMESFNPIGPPSTLSKLAVGQALSLSSNVVTRLSQTPNIFHVANFISTKERKVLMTAASSQGMKRAGTRNSEANTIRKNSYLTWIDPYDISGVTSPEALGITRSLVVKSGAIFTHEALHKNILEGGGVDYLFAEDVQVAKYDAAGRFDYHHDGYSRFLTVSLMFIYFITFALVLSITQFDSILSVKVLIYLNGVGGTYFPFANSETFHNIIDEASAVDTARKRRVGKEGLLLIGKEGAEPYTLSLENMTSKSVVEIKGGDAIAFYSYKPSGEKDWNALHCSLAIPEEKWISTCWSRSEALTGPFSYLKKEAMVEQLQ